MDRYSKGSRLKSKGSMVLIVLVSNTNHRYTKSVEVDQGVVTVVDANGNYWGICGGRYLSPHSVARGCERR